MFDNLKNWEDIPEASYTRLIDGAKEYFNEVSSNDEEITSKSYLFMKILSVIGSALLALYTERKISVFAFGTVSFLCVFEFVLLIILLLPRKSRYRGIYPDAIMNDYIDKSDKKDAAISFMILSYYQENINTLRKSIERRVTVYQVAQVFIFMLSTFLVFLALKVIYYHLI